MKVAFKQSNITSEAAAVAVTAAVNKGAELGRDVNAAVLERGGNLAAFLRSDGASFLSSDIAQDKAYTAVNFGMATSAWDSLFKNMSSAVRAGITQRPRFAGFGGGLPIIVDGDVVGAIGVSGASEEEDEICARAGLDALGL